MVTKRNDRVGALGSLVRATLASARLGELSDGELLTRFVAARDEAAFAELVRRLGPTVYGTCRRILRDAPDAEDAFQVTFLVLARKAGHVRPPGRVAAWLHGVAVLAARKARSARARRRSREARAGAGFDPVAPRFDPQPDLAAVLDEEIQRLPERYRLPVVLCEVRERTVAETAAELGWPVGTVASRLSRGRALLASRLERRGVTGAALATAGALAGAATAAVPARLSFLTVSAAVPAGAGASAVAPPLLREVLRAMTLNKIRGWGVAAALCAAVAFGAAGVVPNGAAAPAPAPAPVAAPAAAPVPVPKPGADGADALGRVKAENLSAMLKVEAIRNDIELTAEQGKKVDAARADAKAGRKGNANPPVIQQGALPNGGRFEVASGGASFSSGNPVADPELDKAIAGVVTPQQLRRLKQLSLQSMGPAALLDRRVIRALGLSAEQEDRVEAVLPPDPRKSAGASSKVVVNGRTIDPAAEALDAGWEAALKVLTQEQRAKWDALVGKMLPTADLQKVHAGALDDLRDRMLELPKFPNFPNFPNLPNVNPNP